MYTTQEEMRGEKERVVSGGGMTFRKDFAERRQALPPKAAGRERKGGKRAKSVYVLYAYFFLFFCASLQTQKWKIILCISLCIHKKEKSVYVKLYTANPANVMRAYVYIRIFKKCSGWFRYTDFRKFCACLFAYFSLREAASLRAAVLRAKCICLYVQKRKQNVYVYIHKKKNKMHMFTYTKFEAICIALRIHKKAAGVLPATEMHMFICVHFFATRKLQREDQRAESKKMHTLYIR